MSSPLTWICPLDYGNFFQSIFVVAAQRIKEVKFSGGVAGATSFRNDHWRPEKAFLPQQPVDNGWHIGPRYPDPGPAHNPPVMIWYDFKAAGILPAEVKETE